MEEQPEKQIKFNMKFTHLLLKQFQFTIALIIVSGIGIQTWLKQSQSVSKSTNLPLPLPISPALLKPSTPLVPLTPHLQQPSPIMTPSQPITPTLPKQTGTDDIYPLTSTSPPPSIPSSLSHQTEAAIHLPYTENAQNLVEIGSFYDRKILLNSEAASAFKQMQLAAKQEGIDIIPISGFRSVIDQEKLFKKQTQRQGSEQAAARLSAPPGFSEHHSGYTLDLADGKSPNTVLKFAFDSTEAYRWLKTHAMQYGFELSFPKNNYQGVSYEPWHWRFISSPRAQTIFQEARKLVTTP